MIKSRYLPSNLADQRAHELGTLALGALTPGRPLLEDAAGSFLKTPSRSPVSNPSR